MLPNYHLAKFRLEIPPNLPPPGTHIGPPGPEAEFLCMAGFFGKIIKDKVFFYLNFLFQPKFILDIAKLVLIYFC
jgi:hypothetical protein